MIYRQDLWAVGAFGLIAVLCVILMMACDNDKSTDSDQPLPLPLQRVATEGNRPTLSPDGDWMAYSLSGSGIVKMALDGGVVETLTTFGLEPDWSRINDLILFRAYDSTLGQFLGTVDATTGDTAIIRFGGWDDGQVWSPNGDEIAAEGSQGLTIISYPEGELSTVPCVDPYGYGCQGEEPTWSSDAQWIAFEDALEILKVQRSGGTAQVVVGGLNDVASPAWSPDGKCIAFMMQDSGSSDWHIWVADARGADSGLWRVTATDTTCTDTLGCFDRSPAWSHDSRTIYFTSNRDGQPGIWRIGFQPE
jgi:Tol biopolymer transport system component